MYCLCAGLVLIRAPVFALDPDKTVGQYIHDGWDSQQGLPQNSVNGVIQGPHGYLWMATFDGLVRFDGVRFVRQPDPDLPGNRLRIVGHDSSGFWVGGEHGGLSRHDGRTAELLPLQTHGIEGSVSHVVSTDSGLWIAGSRGLFLIRSDGTVAAFGAEDGLPDRAVWQIAVDPERSRLFAATRLGLAVADLDDLEAGFDPLDHPAVSDMLVSALLAGENGNLWVGTDHGLVHVHSDGRVLKTLPLWEASEPGSGPAIRALLRDRDENLWIGTWNEGLYRFNKQGAQRLALEDGLGSRRITSLFEDREGSVWFGTDGGGLGRLRDGHATPYSGDKWDVPSPSVTTITEHPDNGLWLGLNCGGVAHFTDDIVERLGHESGLDNTCVFSLLVDSDHRLWVGTHGGGVYRKRGEAFEPVPVPAEHDIVLAIAELENGGIHAGTSKGLLYYDEQAARFTPVAQAGEDPIHQISEDHRGRLWLATLNGIRHGSPKTGFETLGEERLGHVRAIHHGEDGTVWIGTYGNGLFRYDGENLFRFGREQGLAEPVISRILTDGGEHFWLSGNQGIQSIPIDHLHEVAEGERERVERLTIGAREGMHTVETNGGSQPAGVRAEDGSLWFPTVNGIVHLHPDRIRRNPLPPPVEIETVMINGEAYPATGEIEIPAGADNIEIHYTGLSFAVPEKVRFRYRLNEDSPWMEAGNRRIAYYSSIPPGQHRFQVIAANHDGVWTRTGASLDLVARATFRETMWFPVVIGAGTTVVVGLLLGIWLINTRRRERHLAAVVRERTRELEIANQRLEGLARIDGLTGVANRRHFEEVLDAKWKQARKNGEPLALVVIDIDHFKEYNDYHGHLAGDDCLRRVAATIEQCLQRKPDFLARYGGEEFVAILPRTDTDIARALAEKMVRSVAALAIPYGGPGAIEHVTISAGVAAAVPESDDPDPTELLHSADRALYKAKTTGRNIVHVAGG